MNCSKCNAQIEDGADFCTQCGQPARAPENTAQGTGVPPAGKPGLKLRTKILIVSACALVVACAVLIPVLLETARAAKYEEAFALMDSGELPEAKEEFDELKEYKESADMAQQCQNMMDYQDANELMSAGDYAAAKKAFDSLSGYEDSSKLSAECQNVMDYDSAVAFMDAGDNKSALDIFLKLGDYSDASKLAEDCQDILDYDAAKALMEAGDFEKAKEGFSALIGYEDSLSLIKVCENEMDYIAAEKAYDQGEFYSAYAVFYGLSGFKDATDRAEQCIQPDPKTGEIYRNPDYSAKKRSLTFKTPDDGKSTYIKIYSEDGDLVSTLFIASGKKLKVKLPSGTYRFKTAAGAKWFGEKDMFGDEGWYSLVMFGENKDTWTLKSGYIYTLKLRVTSGGNEGLPQSRDSF